MAGSGVDFCVFGRIEAHVDGHPVHVGGRLPRAMLASLLVCPNRVVPSERLINQLWGDAPPASAAGTLHVYLSNLRRALEPDRPARAPSTVLVTQAPGYLLRVDPEAFDATRFERLVGEGAATLAAGRLAAAREVLTEALAIWQGPPYADLASEAWLLPEVTRLRERRAGAMEDLSEARMGLGEGPAAVAELEQLVADEPLRERRWELLALALYRGGRQADALRAIDTLRRTLVEELGLEPRLSVRQLETDILRQAPELERRRPVAHDGPEDDGYLEIWTERGRQVVVLRADSLTIGRSSSSGAHVPEATVSRTHAVVEREEAGWSIRDAGSANGTFVNGAVIGDHSRLLYPGDEIGVGSARLFFRSKAVDNAAGTKGIDPALRRQADDGG